jgi:hypothetical protein
MSNADKVSKSSLEAFRLVARTSRNSAGNGFKKSVGNELVPNNGELGC